MANCLAANQPYSFNHWIVQKLTKMLSRNIINFMVYNLRINLLKLNLLQGRGRKSRIPEMESRTAEYNFVKVIGGSSAFLFCTKGFCARYAKKVYYNKRKYHVQKIHNNYFEAYLSLVQIATRAPSKQSF